MSWSSDVNEVFILLLTCRNNKTLNEKLRRVIFLIKHFCQKHSFIYLDNSNITVEDSWKDGIHILDSGETKLLRNFTYF